MQHVSEMALTLLEQYLSTVITLSSAQPIFEHKGGHVPIAFFSHPFMVISNETRIHGTVKVSIMLITKG